MPGTLKLARGRHPFCLYPGPRRVPAVLQGAHGAPRPLVFGAKGWYTASRLLDRD